MSDERGKKMAMKRIESERSTIAGGSDALLEEGANMEGTDQCSRPFSIIPSGVWNCLRSYYGGGPAIPRLISSISFSHSINIDQDEIRSNHETLDEPTAGRGAWVEINPLSLHLFVCDCAGNALPVPGETIAFRSEGIAAFIFRIISNYVRSSEETTSFPVVDLPDESVSIKFLEESYSSHFAPPLRIEDLLRVWFLVYHTALDVNLDEGTSQAKSIFSPEEPRSSLPSTLPVTRLRGPMAKTTSSSQNKLMIRHGPLSWWVLDDSITSASLSDAP